MFERALYLKSAEELRGNEGQWAAYESKAHCVVLAGPGSGKTKTLTLKLARILAEDIAPPRGVACITYNNECAMELETRLEALGVESGGRVFIGTVHSFSLTQIVLPYAKTAGLELPDGFRVATRQEQAASLEDAYYAVVGGAENPQTWSLRMGNYRRSILNRALPQWRGNDPQLAELVEVYEGHLRTRGLIDFDDMPLLALRALIQNVWLRRALLAKYPVLAVDEYQDLGSALHRMVLGLCFGVGIRLLAVGDIDQSIYGFTGADPSLLQRLTARDDVEVVRLRLNYRSGSRIVAASSYALGEDRGYAAREGASQGTIFFHPRPGTPQTQADYLFEAILPAVEERLPDLTRDDIAVLYSTAAIGNHVADAAARYEYAFVRTDTNSLYPRGNKLMRWLELCASWCCGGWNGGTPRFYKLVNQGVRIFTEALSSDDVRSEFRRDLIAFLWSHRDVNTRIGEWLTDVKTAIVDLYGATSRTVSDEVEALAKFIDDVGPNGALAGMTIGQFCGNGTGGDRINLSTLHSAKGREFTVVVLFGMDQGIVPWNNVSTLRILESRRLFYVGFTRAKSEVHVMYSADLPSAFVREVQNRLAESDAQ